MAPRKQDEFSEVLATPDLKNIDQHEQYIVIEPVFSSTGIPLLSAPGLVTAARLRQLRMQELSPPLSEAIRIALPLSNTQLKQRLEAFIDSNADLKLIHGRTRHAVHIELLFKHLRLEKPVRQQLNALQQILPDHFESSLFAAWLGSLISASQKQNPLSVYNAFVTGLLHDLGMLTVPHSIAQKRGNFSPEEWAFMTAHPQSSATLIGGIRFFDKKVVQAIVEHHELTDGSGYPRGIRLSGENQLTRLVGLADLVYKIWSHQLKPNELTIFDLDNVLRVHASHASAAAMETQVWLLNLLQQIRPDLGDQQPPTGRSGALPDPQNLLRKAGMLNEIRQYTMLFKTASFLKPLGAEGASLMALLKEADSTASATGLDAEAIANWVAVEVCEDPQRYHTEIAEISTAIEETLWIYRRIYRVLGDLISKVPSTESRLLICEAFQMLHDTLTGPNSLLRRIDAETID